MIIALEDAPVTPPRARAGDVRPFMERWGVQLKGCVVALALCAAITLIAMQWLTAFDAANPVMIYLLGVVLVALFLAAGPPPLPR